MSISPSAPEPKESYTYEAASTPRWIFVVFIAAFALIGYVLYAGNDSRNKLESELSQANSKQSVLAAQIEQTVNAGCVRRSYREHFAEFEIGQGHGMKGTAGRCVLDTGEAKREIAAFDGLVDIGPLDLDETAGAVESPGDAAGNFYVEATYL